MDAELIEQTERIQRHLAALQEQLERREVTGMAGAGLVTVTVSGVGRLGKVQVDPSLCDPARVAELERLFVAAVHDAAERARRLAEKTMNFPVGDLNVF